MVSRIIVMMIQGNETKIIENGDLLEVWTVKDGNLHALMVSCNKDQRESLNAWLEQVKHLDFSNDY
jgi:hypothetical protein